MGERPVRRLVAVMFTDMVGFTALMQADEGRALEKRERYWGAVGGHHASFGGTIVHRLGDGSLSMFPSSLAAVQAGVGIQREVLSQDIPVRIGIHVGEVFVEDDQLTGDAVNIASRIESFAVPGAVMLSDVAYDQIKNRGDVSVVALGRFRLKNVRRPFEIYAVKADGLVVPEPAGLEGKGERFVGFQSNLPESGQPLVGRAVDLECLVDMARNHRVVTITGPGGVGKTSVLVELGRMLSPEFIDGVAFVPLADVTDPRDVLPALADALDVKEAEGRSLGEGVITLIGERRVLLLLDNLEQVVAAAADLASLVERCPALVIASTSRAPLRITAEHDYPLAPLAVPPASEITSTEALLDYPSVELFVERARATKGSFELDSENASAVANLCRRLDGLPLALELATARLRLLSPESLVERLDSALDVLKSSQRDAPHRHQTLRATIAWSHCLLSEPEQRLFRRLAVFAGGFTVADVDAVCAEAGESCLNELESLVDNALVQVEGRDDRMRMLQTIGELASEHLRVASEVHAIVSRHARRYAERARELRDGIEGTQQVRSIELGIAEEANLHAAIEALLARARRGDEIAAELGMQMCGDLWMYWHVRGRNLTATEYATAFLEADVRRIPTAGRAGALITMGIGSWMFGRYAQSLEECAEAYRLALEIGAEREACIAGLSQALALIFLEPERGLTWAEESIERSRVVGFDWAEGIASTVAGILHAVLADPDSSEARYTEALAIQRRLGDREGAGMSLGGLAELASGRGDTAAALELYRQSLAAFEAIGDRAEEARILSEMAWTYVAGGDPARARATFFEAIQAHTDLASVRGVGLSLIGLAATEVAEHRPENALRIAAAAEVYTQQEGIAVIYSEDTPGFAFVDQARAALGKDEVARATEAGRKLTVTEALDLARTREATPGEAGDGEDLLPLTPLRETSLED